MDVLGLSLGDSVSSTLAFTCIYKLFGETPAAQIIPILI